MDRPRGASESGVRAAGVWGPAKGPTQNVQQTHPPHRLSVNMNSFKNFNMKST